MDKRTKIVCTLGPASQTKKAIIEMVRAGMNVARLNMSHGTHAEHARLILHIREIEKETGHPIAIILDLQGPKIRLGKLPQKGIAIQAGSTIMLDTAGIKATKKTIPIVYPPLAKAVKKGDRLLIDDGRIETVVQSVQGTNVTVVVANDGVLYSHKGVNIPDATLEESVLTPKDHKDMLFGVEHDVDFIALSFVQSAKDVLDLRFAMHDALKSRKEEGASAPIQIIAKIERSGAVDNIEEIFDVADGVMVARGDLGIEMPAAEVPLIQKRLIDLALKNAKPVIVATQMLDSMQISLRPTRAEVSDVANAVIDHVDAVMLSNETAVGDHPVKVIETMATIITETEKSHYDNLTNTEQQHNEHAIDEVISHMSRILAEEVGAVSILAASLSGETARLISRHRPELPIIVATSSVRVQHQLNLSWGVSPFILDPCKTIEELVERSVLHLKRHKLAQKGDKIIVVAGEPVGHAGHVNLLEVREVQ